MNGWRVTKLPTHWRRDRSSGPPCAIWGKPSFATNAASRRFKGISKWLDDTVVSVPGIKAFKKELIEQGMR
jgi:hypothetical protein